MLVLGRREGQGIKIGTDITVVVARIAEGTVRLGICAPKHVQVLRTELIGERRDETKNTSKEADYKALQSQENDH